MKITKNIATETNSLEIIELAINDLDTLTRAFEMISKVCKEMNHSHISISEEIENLH